MSITSAKEAFSIAARNAENRPTEYEWRLAHGLEELAKGIDLALGELHGRIASVEQALGTITKKVGNIESKVTTITRQG